MTRKYQLVYLPIVKSIEMYDVKNQRIFLKRSEIPTISLDDFFVGSQVTILSRVLKVTDYGDIFTRRRFESERERTFAMIKPDAYTAMGKIIDGVHASGMVINKLKMSRFTKGTAGEFYAEHKGKCFYDGLEAHITSDVVTGMELVSPNAVKKWREVIGPTSTAQAQAEAPGSVRALYGADNTKNAVHGADSMGAYKREVNFWFGGNDVAKRPMQTTAVKDNCTLCLIKPHLLKEGRAGQVIDMILAAGFEISAMEMFNLSRPVCEEFLDVYKGVLPEYLPIVENLSGGPLLALEIRQQNAVSAFRDLCGPHDPEIAKHLRPDTIR